MRSVLADVEVMGCVPLDSSSVEEGNYKLQNM